MELHLKDVPEHPAQVTDSHETSYRLSELLGEGGQGAVFRTVEHGVAIKLIYGDPDETASLQIRLDRMRTRPLWDWPISRPFAVLKPGGQGADRYNGYVMDLRDGAMPISKLIGRENEWEDIADLIRWYNVTTGGLRRRLVLLAGAAEILAWLRAIPFVYADPSPNNILVSQNLADEDVWLIDPDNIGLRRSISPEQTVGTQEARTVYTPGYAASEIVNGRARASTLSDAFSFAVIAYEVLTLRHPFVGDLVDSGPPELVTEAYAGKFPWIEHSSDDTNRSEQGLRPRSLMLNSTLQKLAREAFEAGRDDPAARPGVGRWADALRRAADMTLPCRHCGATFYPFAGEAEPRPKCRWCGALRDGFALMQVKTWVGPFEPIPERAWKGDALASEPAHCFAVVAPDGFKITRRHAYPGSIRRRNELVLEVKHTGDAVELLPRRDEAGSPLVELSFEFRTGEPRHKLTGNMRIPYRPTPAGPTVGPIHFGAGDRTHRVAFFTAFPAT